jgi:phosphoribosylaminoimidazolecarboxamide formyltransferase/IMP cyclohydrolase
MSVAASEEKQIAINKVHIRRALISVSDKTGLQELAEALAARDVEIYSTGGTEQFLRDRGVPVRSVTELTDSPEVFDGRLKTLHPMVHGGLLYRRELPSHVAQAEEHGIQSIDLLVVNLYPFEETRAKVGATSEQIIENIDIGGPAMLRSAAKNFRGVALLTDPAQYPGFLEQYDSLGGLTDLTLRLQLAREAFSQVAKYDNAIADYFAEYAASKNGQSESSLKIDLPLIQTLRYGENPQQRASLYGSDFSKLCNQVWGKELSYNNILDASAALSLISEFAGSERPVCAIIKHTNPCGVAEGGDILEAFNRAFTTDPESPFGGIIVSTHDISKELAERLNEFFSEVILAPSYSAEALEVLKKKKDRRLIEYRPDELRRILANMREVRSVVGGILSQDADRDLLPTETSTDFEFRSVTTHPLSAELERAALFAWKVVKHLKSNAIAYCGIEAGFARTLGLGAGQTSRVESSRLAIEHARRHGLSLTGCVVASDAFFPFADGLIEAANAGAIAAIEPGGSVRDTEVIAAAEERGVALVMTGMRHFKH